MPQQNRTIVATGRNGNQSINTGLTLSEAVAILRPIRDNNFISSLVRDYDRYESVGGNKAAWLLLTAQRQLDRDARPTPAAEHLTDDFDGLSAILRTAVENGKKYPKIALVSTLGKKVVLSLAGPNSRYQGSVMITDGGKFGQNVYYGRVESSGRLVAGGALNDDIRDLLTRFAADPAGVAAAYGRETGMCCFCSMELTDERSVTQGYGPICARNHNLPWGERPVKVVSAGWSEIEAVHEAVERASELPDYDAAYAAAERASEMRGFASDPDFQEFTLRSLLGGASEIAARDGYPVPEFVGALVSDDVPWRDDD